MRIELLKLASGEEIIGRAVDEPRTRHTDTLVLEQVRVLTVHQSPTGEMQIGMMPWVLGSADSEVEIQLDHILAYITTIPDQLEKGYLSQTSKINLL